MGGLFSKTTQAQLIVSESQDIELTDTVSLHRAVVKGSVHSVEKLLNRNNDINCVDENGDSLLHLAIKVYYCNLLNIDELGLSLYVSCFYAKECVTEQQKLTELLRIPSPEWMLQIIRLLNDAGANWNLRNNKGVTPLELDTGEKFRHIRESAQLSSSLPRL